MGTQLLSATGARMLRTILVCCLWAAMSVTALAGAEWTEVSGEMSKSTGGGMTVWKIMGTATAKDIPTGRNVYVQFKYERQAKGDTMWADVHTEVVNTTTAYQNPPALVSKTVTTPWHILAISPAQGDKYRVRVVGTHDDNVIPPGQTDIGNTAGVSPSNPPMVVP